MASKWAILGASGFVGQYLMRNLGGDFNLVGTYHAHPVRDFPNCVQLDITAKDQVSRFLEAQRPAGVVLAAAVSDPNVVKADPGRAENVNVEGPRTVASACADRRIPLIHFSTDYVFNSPKEVKLIQETDTAYLDPANEYGRLKLAAEVAVRRAWAQATILRIALVYGWRPAPATRSNFVLAVLRALRGGQNIDTYTDQYGTPTYIGDIVRCLPRVMLAAESGDALGQVYHLAGLAPITRFDFALLVAKAFDLADKTPLIRPAPQSETATQALRPYCSALDTRKIQKTFHFQPVTYAEGLARMQSETLGADPSLL